MIAASVWHGVRRLREYGRRAGLLLAVMACAMPGQAQSGALQGAGWLRTVAAFPLATPESVGGLVIHQRSATLQPFTVAGECGAFVGQGDGSFEAWTWPVKLLSHLRMTAQLKDYTVPIDVNDQSAEITVQPDHTTITFAHAAFTVREILFATPCRSEGDPGVMALFQISSTRPLALTLSFTPELKRMWPAANYNTPDPEWVELPAGGGYYLLHTDSNELAGAVAMPGTEPGILQPYQERPKNYPLQLVLQYEPARDGDRYFPLLLAAGTTKAAATKVALTQQLAQMGMGVEKLYEGTADYYRHFFDTRLTVETPDARVNQAVKWAEVSIDQLRVRHESAEYGDETGLVAGLYSSGDSNRPGFGWFFGRDSLFTLYAVDSYGDFGLAREELDFLLKRQRADGKIMHEYSQTAELVDWGKLPYEYAAADSTPLLLMLLRDYAERSGDTAYLQQHWAQIALAWKFERTHDTDGDGIYDNAQGTGWVESWPPGMPHQEIYLAALDEQASQAYAALARLAGKPEDGAAERAKAVATTLEREYKPADGVRDGMYAFSYNGAGANGAAKLDTTATIYPAVAWWDGTYGLPASDGMFARWASAEFSTDWGTRDLGEHEALYDPMSYHQGSVWPLFTGWASVAEYRTGRPLAGYAHLMQNVDLTWAQDLGAVTELLSGQYFEPMGRSTTHQLWSSAMVLSPALRGLFGVSYDAVGNGLTVDPQLPATWAGATLRHVPVGDGKRVTLVLKREGGALLVRALAEGAGATFVLPKLDGPGGIVGKDGVLRIPLAGAEVAVPAMLPLPGKETAQLKVLEQHAEAHSATWVLEAKGGAEYALPLRLNGVRGVRAEGAMVVDKAPAAGQTPLAGDALLASEGAGMGAADAGLETLVVRFPVGAGYTRRSVTVRW
jgi:glycogen debranching enzyme